MSENVRAIYFSLTIHFSGWGGRLSSIPSALCLKTCLLSHQGMEDWIVVKSLCVVLVVVHLVLDDMDEEVRDLEEEGKEEATGER